MTTGKAHTHGFKRRLICDVPLRLPGFENRQGNPYIH
jgi:hypothetical protein